jgi:predicted membrane protein
MMNVDANLDDLKDYVGTSIYILKSLNPPILSMHVSNLIMSNFDAYMHRLKKFQCWPHSLLNMWGWCMTFFMGVLEVQCQISI